MAVVNPDGGGVDWRVQLAAQNAAVIVRPDRTIREKLFQLLSELADVVDPDSGTDIQVATVKVQLNAAKGTIDQLGPKAAAAGASWDTHPDDF